MSLIKVDWTPDAKKLRQFGIGVLIFTAAVGGHMLWRGRPAAHIVLPMGSILGAITLAWPAAGQRIYTVWMSIALVIGTIVSTLAMAATYYLIVTPLGLLLRARGRDSLNLTRKPGPSYWIPIEQPADKTYYERLF